MLPRKIHFYIFLIGTSMLVVGLPLSPFMLSLSILLLSANWLAEIIPLSGNWSVFHEKWQYLKSRKAILLLISIYLIHIIWLINTTDFSFAIRDLRIKLPLLALPIIYGTIPKLSKIHFTRILQLFIATVIVSSFITTYVLLGFSWLDPIDSRYASLFISHIRFSLIVVLSIYSLFYLTFYQDIKLPLWQKTTYIVAMIWFICFLILLQSFTGIVIFLILLPVSIIWCSYKRNNRKWIITSYITTLLIGLLILLYAGLCYTRYNKKDPENNKVLEPITLNGNIYLHHPEKEDYENGHKIWIYISKEELKQEWNKISLYKYDSVDRKGQPIHSTLIRYMTSLGLRKDSLGLKQLSPEDIQMIEKGYTNYLYKNKFALYPRIYELLWEMDRYKETGDPSGQSLGQRIEYLKTAMHIIKRHFWFGTGTGDVKMEFYKQYTFDKSLLKYEWRHRTHNQLITFFVTFGITGFLFILFALFTPPILEKKYTYFLFTIFFLIGILSMLNEDTLETHVGASFFAFFYSFFLFSSPDSDDSGS